MRIRTFFYTIGQGIKSLFRNGWYSIASVATITACLFLFGMFYTIIVNFQHMVRSAEEGVSVTVFFKEGTSEDEIQVLKAEVEKRPEVSKVDFQTADEAWDSFKKQYLGDYAGGFPDNPLEGDDNLQIYMKNVSQQANLVTYLESVNIVREVKRSEVTAMTLSAVNRLITLISAGVILVLLGVSIFLISNTVTIGIEIRRNEIEIMKYVGAGDFIVRGPFVIEGMLIGLIGSLIPLALIYVLYGEAVEYFSSKFSILSMFLQFYSPAVIFQKLMPITLGVGVGIGILGSLSSVRRHLNV
ncbi:MAG: ABC transporter permease [Lachnospiraceae bacterium]|jgi:cell division permease ftsX|nr:ABC transporter permease [Lachnospiraceae bacterium]MBF1011900.1 ABC transporter permease [Lachnospiraceae bacterium]